jgi:hypothetical protein
VSGRRGGPIREEDGVGELEEGVAPAAEASVERTAEGAKSIGRFHDAPIMRSPMTLCTPYLPKDKGVKMQQPVEKVAIWLVSRSKANPTLPNQGQNTAGKGSLSP